jgi:hypothetical protein
MAPAGKKLTLLINVFEFETNSKALSKDGGSLWVIVGNTSVAKFDTATLCSASGGKPTPTAAVAVKAPTALSVSPTTGDVFVGDLSTSQVSLEHSYLCGSREQCTR